MMENKPGRLEITWKVGPEVKVRGDVSGRLGGSVRRPTSAWVMISRFMSSSPTLGSVLTAWRLLGILSPLFSLPLPRLCVLSLSFSQNK